MPSSGNWESICPFENRSGALRGSGGEFGSCHEPGQVFREILQGMWACGGQWKSPCRKSPGGTIQKMGRKWAIPNEIRRGKILSNISHGTRPARKARTPGQGSRRSKEDVMPSINTWAASRRWREETVYLIDPTLQPWQEDIRDQNGNILFSKRTKAKSCGLRRPPGVLCHYRTEAIRNRSSSRVRGGF